MHQIIQNSKSNEEIGRKGNFKCAKITFHQQFFFSKRERKQLFYVFTPPSPPSFNMNLKHVNIKGKTRTEN